MIANDTIYSKHLVNIVRVINELNLQQIFREHP